MMRARPLFRTSAAMAILLAALLIAACGGSASPGGGAPPAPTTATSTSPTPTTATATTATTAATATPVALATATGTPAASLAALVALGEQIFPPTPDGAAYMECSNGRNAYDNCPMTDRLQQRLRQVMVTICRCQNPAASRPITAGVTTRGGVIHVSYGNQRFDLVAVSQAWRLLVGDQRCRGGNTATSIYREVAPCPVS